jgi:short-subunit dehydrogenase
MGSSLTWKNRTAIISGGSNGLGRAIAVALAKQSAHLVIIGRDTHRLQAIEKQAIELGAASVSTLSIDARKIHSDPTESSQTAIANLKDILAVQGCDLLINAVGKSDRGSLEQLSEEELVEQFGLNVLATHSMTKFCWPALCQNRGVVVNIASLAGVVAGPGMGGYSMAKHGLVGLHRQWRLESQTSGVHFLLVCPGPIAREDSADRYAELAQTRGLDHSSVAPGGGVKLRRLDPDELSQRILKAAQDRKLELVVPGKVRLLAALTAFWPSIADRIIRKKMKRS